MQQALQQGAQAALQSPQMQQDLRKMEQLASAGQLSELFTSFDSAGAPLPLTPTRRCEVESYFCVIDRPTHTMRFWRFRLGKHRPTDRRAKRGEENFGSERPDRPTLFGRL